MRIMVTPTSRPKTATARSGNDSVSGLERARARAKQAAQVADHPSALATEPTSVMGIRMASPSNMQAPVARPMQRTAAEGV